LSGNPGIVEQLVADEKLPGRVLVFLLLFGAVMALTVVSYDVFRDTLMGQIVEDNVEELTGFLDFPMYVLPLLIFVNNAIVAITVTFLSVTLIWPLISITMNGAVVGYVVASTLTGDLLGSPLPLDMARMARYIFAVLTPHGSVEIPAIALAASTAFYVVDKVRGEPVSLGQVFKRNLVATLLMLAAAAILETTVSFVFALIAVAF